MNAIQVQCPHCGSRVPIVFVQDWNNGTPQAKRAPKAGTVAALYGRRHAKFTPEQRNSINVQWAGAHRTGMTLADFAREQAAEHRCSEASIYRIVGGVSRA